MLKKTIIGILILSSFASCVTEKKRMKICDNCPTVTNTLTKDSLVYRDSTIILPGETIRDTIKIECDDNNDPVISISRAVRGKNITMDITSPDVNTVVSQCTIDSLEVYLSWVESHSNTQTTIEPKITKHKGINWQLILLSIVMFAVGYFFASIRRTGNI